MASRVLPGLGLSAYWNLGESGWKAGMDGNLRKLSSLTQLTVKSAIAVLPTSPTEGDIYIVTSGVNASDVAVRDAGAWVYFSPNEGWLAWNQDANDLIVFDGSLWVSARNKKTSFGNFAAGVLASDGLVGASVMSSITTFDAGAGSSIAKSLVAATASSVLKIQRSASGTLTDIGTITFDIGATSGVVSFTAQIALAVGDLLIVRAPSTADATLADVAISLVGSVN